MRRVNFTLVNDAYPFACANIDRRVIGENAILECKTTNSAPNMKLFRQGEYPESWYCQMTHYLAVTGAERAYLAVLIGCREFKVFTLERDEDEIAALMQAEADFWQHVKDDTPPAITAKDSSAVAGSTPVISHTAIDLTPELQLLQEYAEAVAAAKEATAKADTLKNRICAALGEHDEGRAYGYHVKWTAVTRNTFSTKAFEKANPGIDLHPYYTASTSRRFEFIKDA